MSTDLSNIFAGVIAQAAKTPATTGATAAAKERIERVQARQAHAGTARVLLLDVSSSMDERAGAKRKIDILRDALEGTYPQMPDAQLVTFASTVAEIRLPENLPAPAGGTALHLGLDAAAAHRPASTLVISDGRPDDEDRALEAAERLTGAIDVIYCGPDDDRQAVDFMRRLARVGGGRVHVHDLRREAGGGRALAGTVRAALALPAAPESGR